MKKAFIPFDHIDALSYGPIEYFIQRFQSWLYEQRFTGVKVLIIPEPRSQNEKFSLGMSGIRDYIRPSDFTVVSESKLKQKGVLKEPKKPQPPPFKFPNPFDCLVV
jgi:hypothetical protein